MREGSVNQPHYFLGFKGVTRVITQESENVMEFENSAQMFDQCNMHRFIEAHFYSFKLDDVSLVG